MYVHTAHPTVQDALLLPRGISAQAQQAAEGFIFQKKNPPLFPFYFVRGIDNFSSAAGRKRGNEMAT